MESLKEEALFIAKENVKNKAKTFLLPEDNSFDVRPLIVGAPFFNERKKPVELPRIDEKIFEDVDLGNPFDYDDHEEVENALNNQEPEPILEPVAEPKIEEVKEPEPEVKEELKEPETPVEEKKEESPKKKKTSSKKKSGKRKYDIDLIS